MDKNKSIDGLKPRQTKVVIKPPKKVTPVSDNKPAKKSKPKTATKSTKASKNIPSPAKSTTKELKKNLTEPIESQSSATPEDFLKPVQAFDFDEESGELKASSKSPQLSQNNPKKAKKKMSKKRKITLSIILVILILLIGAGIAFILWGNDIIAKITGGQGNVLDLIFHEETYVNLKTDENGRTNVLAFGTSGYDMEGNENYGIHDGAQLTDSIMVISLDQKTGDIAMLSLPRDLKASPTCTATGKINEVYWCNNMDGENEQAGAEALMTEVGSILGLDFQYYAHLNWGSLVQIVDALGGITITLDEDVEDYYYTGIVFEAGKPYTISGIEAVALARARHGTTSGDFSRGASQQKILIGIKDKVLEKDLSITDLIGLAGTLGDNLRTNFSIEEMRSLAHLTNTSDFDSVRQISLIEPTLYMTNGTINGISYVIPSSGQGNYGNIQAYVAKMFSSDPRTYEDYNILVLNGTEEVGLASTEKTTLINEGYNNIEISDAPTTDYQERYTLYASNSAAPGVKRLLESKYSITSKSYDELPPEISRDYNFVLILGAPSNDSN